MENFLTEFQQLWLPFYRDSDSLFVLLSYCFMYGLMALQIIWIILTIPMSIYASIVYGEDDAYFLSLKNEHTPTGIILTMSLMITGLIVIFAPIIIIGALIFGSLLGFSYFMKYLKERENPVNKLEIENDTLKTEIEKYKLELKNN